MAIFATKENNKLNLEFDNGDFNKIYEILEKWKFKDEESLLRFMMGLLFYHEESFFKVVFDGVEKNITPSNDLLRAT